MNFFKFAIRGEQSELFLFFSHNGIIYLLNNQLNSEAMKIQQNQIDFPSPELQKVVEKLWSKIHEINGTVNFLIERNNELKEKLDARGVISPEDIAKMKEMERNIESLELENEDYLSNIAKLKQENAALSEELSAKSVFQKNYEILISAYNKLKSESISPKRLKELEALLQETTAQNEDYESQLVALKEELDAEKLKLQQAKAEIINLQKIIEHNEAKVKKASELQAELDKMSDMIDSISASRDAMQEETDSLKLEIERLKSIDSSEIAKLKNQIDEFAEERSALENDIIDLSRNKASLQEEKNELELKLQEERDKFLSEISELKNQIDAQNEQLANSDALVKSIEQKNAAIEKLSNDVNKANSEKILFKNKFEELQAKYELLENDYVEATKAIEGLNDELLKIKEESSDLSEEEFAELKNELQVKEKMLNDYVAGEKDLLNKLQYFEKELDVKEKGYMEALDKAKEGEEKIENLQLLLEQKDSNIDDLIRLNKTLKGQVEALEQSATEGEAVSEKLEELKKGYEQELNKITAERNRLEKELKAKSNNIMIMEIQINNLKEKLREYELNQIKTDEAISLDSALRENLIANIESQLKRLDKILGDE